MLETVGDIWRYSGAAVIALTTSGSVARNGRAVVGRGVARQAVERFPGIAETLGRLIEKKGNHVFDLGHNLVTFPVEETAWSTPDPRLIARSASELRILADRRGWRLIIVPRPGCGGGGLAWHEVRPLLEPRFDDRFVVIHNTQRSVPDVS